MNRYKSQILLGVGGLFLATSGFLLKLPSSFSSFQQKNQVEENESINRVVLTQKKLTAEAFDELDLPLTGVAAKTHLRVFDIKSNCVAVINKKRWNDCRQGDLTNAEKR
jgi:hypothetical protein